MKTEEQIKEQIEKISKDERLGYRCATVYENAPLALIQLELETTIKVLNWVLT